MGPTLFALPLIYITAAVLLALFPRLPRKGAPVLLAAGGLGFIITVLFFKSALEGSLALPVQSVMSWFDLPYFETVAGVYADGLSAAAAFAASLAALLCALFALGETGRPATSSYPAMLLYAGAALGVVLADSMVCIFVFWQLQTLAIYIAGTDREDPCRSSSAKLALFYNVAADLALLAAIIYSVSVLGTARLSQLLVHVPPGHGLLAFCALITLAVFIKAGQFPFTRHMSAAVRRNGPAFGALIASAGILTACYLPARLYPVFAQSTDARTLLAAGAALSATLCAMGAMAADDIFSACALAIAAQAGLGMCCLGIGLYTAGVFHIFNTLFMGLLLLLCAGTLAQAATTPRFDRMSGMKYTMPVTQLFFITCALALCGMPPLCGFFSLSHIMASAAAAEPNSYPVLLCLMALNACAAVRIGTKAFGGDTVIMPDKTYQTPGAMHAPIVVLAVVVLFSGWAFDHEQIFAKLITPLPFPPQDDFPFLPAAIPYCAALLLGAGVPLYFLTRKNNTSAKLQKAFDPLRELARNGFGEIWLDYGAAPLAQIAERTAAGCEALLQKAVSRSVTAIKTAPGLIASAATAAGRASGNFTDRIFSSSLSALSSAYDEDALPSLAAAIVSAAAIAAYIAFN